MNKQNSYKFLGIFCLFLLIAPIASFAQGAGKYFGEINSDTGAMVLFQVNRNKIIGHDFNLTLPGICLYDDGEFEENTFTIGGGDFPDLPINNRLRVKTEIDVVTNSFHEGTLNINCKFKKNNRNKLKSAKCSFDFYSPARPDEQLDYCSAEITLNKIVKGGN